MAPSSSSSQHQPSAAADPALLARVREHDAFFCWMVDLVPPELYLPKDEEAAAAADANAKYYKVSSRVCVFVRVALVLVDRLGGWVGSLLRSIDPVVSSEQTEQAAGGAQAGEEGGLQEGEARQVRPGQHEERHAAAAGGSWG